MVGRVLVTGGTGTLGRLVVDRLRDAGRPVRVLSRRHREPVDGVEMLTGDLRTGAGVADAVAGVEAIVHCASAWRGDEETTRRLVAAAEPTTPHLVYISIVGVERVSMGYYRSKLAAERVLAFADVIRAHLRARHRRRPVVAVRLPGLAAVRAGGLLPTGAHRTGTRSWADFLAARYP